MSLLSKLQSLFQGDRVNVNERFELLREAVSGTMSNFYAARDRKTGKTVGLKIADREKLTTFENRFKGLNKPPEGEIAMKFNHPNIVQTFEHGFTTTGLAEPGGSGGT
jgi:eukaryotic-like serine/threonine-protein kinase